MNNDQPKLCPESTTQQEIDTVLHGLSHLVFQHSKPTLGANAKKAIVAYEKIKADLEWRVLGGVDYAWADPEKELTEYPPKSIVEGTKESNDGPPTGDDGDSQASDGNNIIVKRKMRTTQPGNGQKGRTTQKKTATK